MTAWRSAHRQRVDSRQAKGFHAGSRDWHLNCRTHTVTKSDNRSLPMFLHRDLPESLV